MTHKMRHANQQKYLQPICYNEPFQLQPYRQCRQLVCVVGRLMFGLQGDSPVTCNIESMEHEAN